MSPDRRFPLVLDDAAIFPPGNLPLAEAVTAHRAHLEASYADLVGPLVVPAAALADLPALAGPAPLDVAVVVPSPADVAAVLQARAGVRVVVLEVALPDDLEPGAVVPALDAALAEETPTVHVELPRDHRRDAVIAELAGTPYRAKLRTGGVRADLYPDEAELAAAVVALVRAGVAFKATAGLHHAVRNTDPATGFEQHGFLNLLVATDAALHGADATTVGSWLAERDGRRLADRVAGLSPRARELFRSFGTCSIDEPVAELAALGLLGEVVS